MSASQIGLLLYGGGFLLLVAMHFSVMASDQNHSDSEREGFLRDL